MNVMSVDFSQMPSAISEDVQMAAPEAFGIKDRIRAAMARINWVAVAFAALLEGLFLAGLVMMGVVPVSIVKREPTVVTLISIEQPPAAAPSPAPVKTEQKPVVKPEATTALVTPPPVVAIPSPASPLVTAPAPPTPLAAPAPSAAASASAMSSGAGPVSVANMSTNLLNGKAPAYPMASRRKREEGMVILRLVISEDGRVADIAINRSSGFSLLDEAAIAAVRKWRWSPTMRDGKPVPITGLVQIPFVLKDS